MHVRRFPTGLQGCEDEWKGGRVQMWVQVAGLSGCMSLQTTVVLKNEGLGSFDPRVCTLLQAARKEKVLWVTSHPVWMTADMRI